MKDKEIDDLFDAALADDTDRGPDAETLDRITAAVQTSLKPVRPLPSRGVLTAGLFLIAAAVAILGAARVGFFGIAQMAMWQRLMIFPALAILVMIAAAEFVSAMIPGNRRRISSGTLLTVSVAVLLGLFTLCFPNYQTTDFIAAGVNCLIRGTLHAVPTAILCWLLLRRGFAVRPVSAGLAAGALAGLAGLGVLELNCSNFQAAHVLVWHTAVVVVSALAGALTAYLLHLLKR